MFYQYNLFSLDLIIYFNIYYNIQVYVIIILEVYQAKVKKAQVVLSLVEIFLFIIGYIQFLQDYYIIALQKYELKGSAIYFFSLIYIYLEDFNYYQLRIILSFITYLQIRFLFVFLVVILLIIRLPIVGYLGESVRVIIK